MGGGLLGQGLLIWGATGTGVTDMGVYRNDVVP